MPPLTRWFIKASLVYLVIALLEGMWIVAQPALGLPLPPGMSPVFFHLFLVGWVTQIIFGVAYWMLPKYSRQAPRRSESLGAAVFWLLNVGLVLRVVGEPLQAASRASLWGWLLAASALAQWLAGLGFVVNTWGRVKER